MMSLTTEFTVSLQPVYLAPLDFVKLHQQPPTTERGGTKVMKTEYDNVAIGVTGIVNEPNKKMLGDNL